MLTRGDIFRRYGPAYRAQFGERMLPSHHAAMAAIEACRTEALGGQVYSCPGCGTKRYTYHSCRNRHCTVSRPRHLLVYLPCSQSLYPAVNRSPVVRPSAGLACSDAACPFAVVAGLDGCHRPLLSLIG